MSATKPAQARHKPWLLFNMVAGLLGGDIFRPGVCLLAMSVLVVGIAPALAAAPKDWRAVPGHEVVLFQPGQRSWEWVLTQAEHAGAKKFREGKSCRACHDGEQKEMGKKLAAGQKPPLAKPGHLSMTVKAVHDQENIYFYLAWQDETSTRDNKQANTKAARVTIMLDDGSLKEAARAGCWGSCHDDAAGMSSAPAGKTLSKYLHASRTSVTRQGGGESYKSPAEMAALLGRGQFFEYWQAQLRPGAAAQAVDGYVLDKRHEHAVPLVRADVVNHEGGRAVVLARKLRPASALRKDIVPGKTYHVGFAVHDDDMGHRFHYVSLEYSFRLDAGPADFVVIGK